jgi:thiamine phosphate synthase YjbQ (UPF0047 family)
VGASLFVSVQQGDAVRVCRDLVSLRTSRRRQFVDLTELVAERVRRSGVSEGMVTVQSRQASAAVLVSEDDLLDERSNGRAPALLLGASVCLNVAEGKVDLSEGQRLFLVELDGPRDRTLSVQVLGVPADRSP